MLALKVSFFSVCFGIKLKWQSKFARDNISDKYGIPELSWLCLAWSRHSENQTYSKCEHGSIMQHYVTNPRSFSKQAYGETEARGGGGVVCYLIEVLKLLLQSQVFYYWA